MLRTSASPASVIGPALVAVFSGRARGQDVDFPPSGKQLSQIEAMAHDDSSEASLHYYRGLGYWGKHKLDEAGSALRLAIQLDPRYAERFYRRAFMIDPLVSLRIMSLVWPVDERGFGEYTSEESQLYQLYFEGFVDLSNLSKLP